MKWRPALLMSDSDLVNQEDGHRLPGGSGELGRKTALVTGSVAIGALITGSVVRRLRHLTLQEPQEPRPALEAEVAYMEVMEGRACYYRRDGSGVPIVLLHSINAAASSHEMKPVFDHLAAQTKRPIYALDWIGFGRSECPPVRYSSSIYVRQFRRFLREHVRQPADLISLSLGAEHAAEIAHRLPYLVRRLVLISPTGISSTTQQSPWRKALVSASDSVGAFEIFYYRLTKPSSLRRFYERQVFLGPPVPDELVAYAADTANVIGAHHAPRYFIQGDLSVGAAPYIGLSVPTLLIAPENDTNLVQRFGDLERLAAANPVHLRVARLPSGLMPQWETPDALFETIDSFLGTG